MINLASALVIVATTLAALLYVLTRPHLDGRRRLMVVALGVLAGVPAGFVLFALLSMASVILFWDSGVGGDVLFLYFSAPIAVLLNVMLVLIAALVNVPRHTRGLDPED